MIIDKNISQIFDRGVIAEVLPSNEEFLKNLATGQKLKIYFGADPTSGSLHLGHAGNYLILEDLRKLGHEVTILIGDFTAQIGDPSDRSSARVQLTEKEVAENMKDWLKQIKPLIGFDDKNNPPKIVYNSQWLSKLTFKDVVELASNFTVQQTLERDMFQKRLKEGSPIHLHEFLYPLMQGYDSVALETDVELCGTDQIFNALAGRTLLRRYKNKEKFVIAAKLLADSKTDELMSKSRGTGVMLSLEAAEMHGAIMAQSDGIIRPLLIHCTRVPVEEVENIMRLEPMGAKTRTAFEIVKIFYGEGKARAAKEEFDKTFREGGLPEKMPEIDYRRNSNLADELIKKEMVSSKTEWRRLVKEGAVRDENDEKIDDPDFSPDGNMVLKIGKRRFVKITIS